MKHEEKHIQESYYTQNGEIVREEKHFSRTRFYDTPSLRKILSDSLAKQDPRLSVNEQHSKFLSFNSKHASPELLPKDSAEYDFTDESFLKIPQFKKTASHKGTNFYSRATRSKTFKEDDPRYFQVSTPPHKKPRNRGSENIKKVYSEEYKLLKQKSVQKSPKIEAEKIDAENNQADKLALVPTSARRIDFDEVPQQLGRIIKSSTVDHETKEKEESIIVQNQEDIILENQVRSFPSDPRLTPIGNFNHTSKTDGFTYVSNIFTFQ